MVLMGAVSMLFVISTRGLYGEISLSEDGVCELGVVEFVTRVGVLV